MTFDFPVSKNILLTGAGFTHNFGGYLANTMWAEIHNRYQRYSRDITNNILIKDFKNEYDYEELYQAVIYGKKYPQAEKDAFIKAVFEAYQSLDDIIRFHKDPTKFIYTRPASVTNLFNMLYGFIRSVGEKAFFFTLNQDLLVERYLSSSPPELKIVCPGLKVNYSRFNIGSEKQLEESDYIEIPSQEELEILKKEIKSLGNLYYIKLHGSYDWRDKGKKVMVIGTSKKDHIRSIPILSWYYELFQDVLNMPNRRMLIIGYGFRDTHINELLAKATVDKNLRIYIISPYDPEYFRKNIVKINQGWSDKVWKAVDGYYPYTLADIIPHGSESQYLKNMNEDFFL